MLYLLIILPLASFEGGAAAAESSAPEVPSLSLSSTLLSSSTCTYKQYQQIKYKLCCIY